MTTWNDDHTILFTQDPGHWKTDNFRFPHAAEFHCAECDAPCKTSITWGDDHPEESDVTDVKCWKCGEIFIASYRMEPSWWSEKKADKGEPK